jgi:hypothetical protein
MAFPSRGGWRPQALKGKVRTKRKKLRSTCAILSFQRPLVTCEEKSKVLGWGRLGGRERTESYRVSCSPGPPHSHTLVACLLPPLQGGYVRAGGEEKGRMTERRAGRKEG